jgi:hypothetical protein
VADSELSDLQLTVLRTSDLSHADVQRMVALFARSYRDANCEYLRASMQHLTTAAVVFHAGELVAFSLAHSRRIDLPRLPATVVRLAGLACVAHDFRRRRLMSTLSGLVVGEGFPGVPGLVCGRMAHPASFRGMTRLPGAVPKLGMPPTAWQQEVGRVIADAYGAAQFDPRTFVCRGSGRPIGYPVIDVEATPEEWELFRPVNRARGDSLLGIAWLGDAPAGW